MIYERLVLMRDLLSGVLRPEAFGRNSLGLIAGS
jgi:hypothetical protein